MTQEEQEYVTLLEAKCKALQLRLDNVTETLVFTKELKEQSDRLESIARNGNKDLIATCAAKEREIQSILARHASVSGDRDRLRKTILELEDRIRQLGMSKMASELRIAKAENKELKTKLRDVQKLLQSPKERKSK